MGEQTTSENFDYVALGRNVPVEMKRKLKTSCETSSERTNNYVSRTARNNGVAARIVPPPNVAPTPGGTLSVAAGGSVLETFVQFEPFYTGRDMYVLRPKLAMTAEELMFCASCLRANQ
jgi:hypothetical protein